MSISLATPAPPLIWTPPPTSNTFHIVVHLRDTETGQASVFEPGWEHDEDHDLWYQWCEGNYSCDCNRMAFLTGDSETDWPCSGTQDRPENRVVVDLLFVKETGKVLMRDNRWVD